jgi:hypothetical protein
LTDSRTEATDKQVQAEVDKILATALKEPGIMEAVELYEAAMAYYHAANQQLAPVVRSTASSSNVRWS